MKSFKSRIHSMDSLYGTFVFEFFEPGVPVMARQAGCEFIVWDMEHSGVSFERLKPVIAVSRAIGLQSIVRVPQLERHFITRALDMGAGGIMIPMVESAEQMRQAIHYAKFAPVGMRGNAFRLAHDDYTPGSSPEKLHALNESVILVPLIESEAGIANIDAILALDEVDCLWLGPADLTHSLGIPGDYGHPLFMEAVLRISRACAEAGKPYGIICDESDAADWHGRGARLLACSADVWLFQSALTRGIQQMMGRINPQ